MSPLMRSIERRGVAAVWPSACEAVTSSATKPIRILLVVLLPIGVSFTFLSTPASSCPARGRVLPIERAQCSTNWPDSEIELGSPQEADDQARSPNQPRRAIHFTASSIGTIENARVTVISQS